MGVGPKTNSGSGGISSLREWSRAISRAGLGGTSSGEVRLPCGLFPSQVSDLLFRDITPNDYDLLLLLDEKISRPKANLRSVEQLPAATAREFNGGVCSICLTNFDSGDSVARTSCKHFFHRACIAKWLLEHSPACPLCGTTVTTAA